MILCPGTVSQYSFPIEFELEDAVLDFPFPAAFGVIQAFRFAVLPQSPDISFNEQD
jgi:hypothetical protein